MVQIQLQRVLAHIEEDCRSARGGSCLWRKRDTESCFLYLLFSSLVRSSDYISHLDGQPFTSEAGSDFHSQLSRGVALRKCLLADSPFSRGPRGGKCGSISEFKQKVGRRLGRTPGMEWDSPSNRFSQLPIHLPFYHLTFKKKNQISWYKRDGLEVEIEILKKDVSIEQTISVKQQDTGFLKYRAKFLWEYGLLSR